MQTQATPYVSSFWPWENHVPTTSEEIDVPFLTWLEHHDSRTSDGATSLLQKQCNVHVGGAQVNQLPPVLYTQAVFGGGLGSASSSEVRGPSATILQSCKTRLGEHGWENDEEIFDA